VPIDLEGLDARPADDPSPAFRGEGVRATETREGFLLRHLRRVLGERAADGTITLSHGAVWVDPDSGLLPPLRAAVAKLAASRDRLYRIRVRAAVVGVADEERLAGGRDPYGEIEAGEGVRVARLSGDDLRKTGYVLSGTKGRYPLLREVLLARPTQLVHTLRSTRFSYLSGFYGGKTGEPGSGFPVYDTVEEGLAVEVRPTPSPDGGIRLSVRVRVARILDTESDRTGSERPVLSVAEALLAADVTKDDALIVSGLPAPTPVVDRRERLVLLLEATETGLPE
jgi:hypothetical protein